jgi:hypothetical protein
MDATWVTLVASLGGTLAGGVTAAYIAIQPWRVGRDERAKKARRAWRGDFYHDQGKLCYAIESKDAWWPDEAQLPRFASTEDVGVVSHLLGGEKWETVSGAYLRILTLEKRRLADIRRSRRPWRRGTATVQRSGGKRIDAELWKLYKVMELSRKALADKEMPFKPRPTLPRVEKAIGHSIWIKSESEDASDLYG